MVRCVRAATRDRSKVEGIIMPGLRRIPLSEIDDIYRTGTVLAVIILKSKTSTPSITPGALYTPPP